MLQTQGPGLSTICPRRRRVDGDTARTGARHLSHWAAGRRRCVITTRAPPIAGGDLWRWREAWTTTTRNPLLLFLFLGLLSSRAAAVASALHSGANPPHAGYCGTDAGTAQP